MATILAQWITLKILVAEHNEPDEWVTPLEERAAFMADRTIPPNFRIWLGYCGRYGWQAAYLRHSGRMMWSTGERPARKNVHSVTFGIGDLFVHAFHSTLPGLALYSFNETAGLLTLLHPSVGPVMWPPQKRISLPQARAIADAYKTATSGSHIEWKP
jgi:hypothetical protein